MKDENSMTTGPDSGTQARLVRCPRGISAAAIANGSSWSMPGGNGSVMVQFIMVQHGSMMKENKIRLWKAGRTQQM